MPQHHAQHPDPDQQHAGRGRLHYRARGPHLPCRAGRPFRLPVRPSAQVCRITTPSVEVGDGDLGQIGVGPRSPSLRCQGWPQRPGGRAGVPPLASDYDHAYLAWSQEQS
jgi:hypothetical protein